MREKDSVKFLKWVRLKKIYPQGLNVVSQEVVDIDVES